MTVFKVIPNKMTINSNVLNLFMKNGVPSNVYNSLIITS